MPLNTRAHAHTGLRHSGGPLRSSHNLACSPPGNSNPRRPCRTNASTPPSLTLRKPEPHRTKSTPTALQASLASQPIRATRGPHTPRPTFPVPHALRRLRRWRRRFVLCRLLLLVFRVLNRRRQRRVQELPLPLVNGAGGVVELPRAFQLQLKAKCSMVCSLVLITLDGVMSGRRHQVQVLGSASYGTLPHGATH